LASEETCPCAATVPAVACATPGAVAVVSAKEAGEIVGAAAVTA